MKSEIEECVQKYMFYPLKVVVHACNLRLEKWKQEDQELPKTRQFEALPGMKERLIFILFCYKTGYWIFALLFVFKFSL